MQIVIDIPSEIYTNDIIDKINSFLNDYFNGTVCETTLLPRGHGRLIDADELKTYEYHIPHDKYYNYMVVSSYDIDEMSTIIKAD